MGDRSSLTDLIVDNSHHLIHLHFSNLHSFLGWEILPVNETLERPAQKRLAKWISARVFFQASDDVIEQFKIGLCRKGIFLPEELNLESVHKETPRGIGGSFPCLAVKGEAQPLSDNTLHRGIRDQGRGDCASAPACSLMKMKSTAENSLP